jgi:predicted nucleic acid-binding protein
MNLLLDTGILGRLCHPRRAANRAVTQWLSDLLADPTSELDVFLPEIADYELRRKLLHLIHRKQATERSTRRLDELGTLLSYLPLDTETMRRAAELWAQARIAGHPTAADPALDGDVILAAKAEAVDGVVVTENTKHLSQFVETREWQDVVIE